MLKTALIIIPKDAIKSWDIYQAEIIEMVDQINKETPKFESVIDTTVIDTELNKYIFVTGFLKCEK